jgi:hypothetical protein
MSVRLFIFPRYIYIYVCVRVCVCVYLLTYRNARVNYRISTDQTISEIVVPSLVRRGGKGYSSLDEQWLTEREANLEDSRNHTSQNPLAVDGEPGDHEST